MSTRSVIARKQGNGFKGVYHHWDGYPSALGATLFYVRNKVFNKDTKRMLQYLIDVHPAGWSTINADWTIPAGVRPNDDYEICEICGKPNWAHYRQYYKENIGSPIPSAWELAGRPEIPECTGDSVLVLGHGCKRTPKRTGPEPFSGEAQPITNRNAAECGCEWAYVFDGNGTMEIQASFRQNGRKMIGAFGCGDPESTWKTVAVVNLDGTEPDWKAIEEKA